MYRKILVPLDGSRLSEGVLPYARSLAKALKVPVELLQVIEPNVISALSYPDRGRYVDVVEAEMKGQSINYLNGVASSFSNSSTITCSVAVGNPAEIIVAKGLAEADTLVAMATHGRSGIQRWMLGGVAHKVLQAVANPLLLVRATDQATASEAVALKTILVSLDGSALAEKVLPYVTTLAKKMDSQVIFVRVHEPLATAYVADEYGPDLDQLNEEMRKEAREYLEGKVRDLESEGVANVSSLLLQGKAAEEIVDLARKTPDSLVAICTHGRSGIGRWVLGSVTENVVRHSGDPVLIIRAWGEAR